MARPSPVSRDVEFPEEPLEVGILPGRRCRRQGHQGFQVIQHQQDAGFVQDLDRQPQPLGNRPPAVAQHLLVALAFQPLAGGGQFVQQPQAEQARLLAAGLQRDDPPAVLLAAVGQARGQGALAGPADAGQQHHGLLAAAQGRPRPLEHAAAADEAGAQPADVVAQQLVAHAGPLGPLRRLGFVQQPVDSGRGVDLRQGETGVQRVPAADPHAALVQQVAAGGADRAIHALARGQFVKQVAGKLGRPVVGDAGAPADGQRHVSGRGQALAQPRHARLGRLAAADEHQPHAAAGEQAFGHLRPFAGVQPAPLVLETEPAHAVVPARRGRTGGRRADAIRRSSPAIRRTCPLRRCPGRSCRPAGRRSAGWPLPPARSPAPAARRAAARRP